MLKSLAKAILKPLIFSALGTAIRASEFREKLKLTEKQEDDLIEYLEKVINKI